MPQQLTKEELEDQLRLKSDEIQSRIDSLKREVSYTGTRLRDRVLRSPVVAVGGAVAAGLLFGLLFGGRRGKQEDPALRTHRALVEGYLDAVAREAGRKVDGGKDPERAFRDALRGHAPIIVYSPGEARKREIVYSPFREVVDMAVKTAVGFGIKTGLDVVTQRLTGLGFLGAVSEAMDTTSHDVNETSSPVAGMGVPSPAPAPGNYYQE